MLGLAKSISSAQQSLFDSWPVPPSNQFDEPSKYDDLLTVPDVQPTPLHRMKAGHSILSLAVSRTHIFAGTEKGQIIIYSISTGDQVKVLDGHGSSVLDLFICVKSKLLFSSSGDRIVNIWCTSTFKRIYSIYSTYDVGDLFCVVYSPKLQTVYLGAQNTSIQWYDLKEKETRPCPAQTSHPHFRIDKFFDSAGPGGYRSPRPDEGRPCHQHGGQSLEIDREYIFPYAHYGYVYCMTLYDGSTCGNSANEVLITGGGEGTIKIWALDKQNGGRIQELDSLSDGQEEGNSVLCFALDGSFLYSGRLGGEINVWDLETKQLIRNLHTATGDIMTMSVGGGILYAGGVTGLVEKFDKDHKFISQFQTHQGKILASTMALSDDTGKIVLLTGGSDHAVVMWDLKDQREKSNSASSNDQLVESLREFVAFQSVSSDIQYKEECHRCASYLRSTLEKFGAVTQMLTSDQTHNPVIFGRFRGNPKTVGNRKKILFYGHYDVVDAREGSKWSTDPFSLEAINGHLYGRGISDNKGPVMAAIYAAAELNATQMLEADLLFLIEGEEESGSRGFRETIRKHRELIGDVDWIILSNSYWLDDETPCITYGLRGVIRATVQVESDFPDLHSGLDGSASHDEALKDLVTIISKLSGPGGRIELPKFHDSILPITADEEALYASITETLKDRHSNFTSPDELANSFKRRWREPSLTVHWFKTSAPDNSTVIPYLAQAAISLRLVPNQTTQEVANSLTQFLNEQFQALGTRNKLSVTIDHVAEPWLGDVNNKIFSTLEEGIVNAWKKPCKLEKESSPGSNKSSPDMQEDAAANLSSALKSSLGLSSLPADTVCVQPKFTKPLYIREGGSIPAIKFLEDELGAPAAQFPMGQASDSAHLDNERLRMTNLFKGKEILGWIFEELPRR